MGSCPLREFLRSASALNATVELIVESGATFDVVTASHVIEQVPDPVEFLSRRCRLLRPGGRVVLKTPNAGSFGSHRHGRAWRGSEPPGSLRGNANELQYGAAVLRSAAFRF